MKSSTSLSKVLPVPGLYHSHNHSSVGNFLVYQTSMNQIRLIEYDNTLMIKETFSVITTPEPIKSISIIQDHQADTLYFGVAFLTKYAIYHKTGQLTSQRVKLDRNIVAFYNTFAASDARDNGKQTYFIFVTATAQFHVVPTDNPQMKSIIKININQRICSMKIVKDYVVVGDERGVIYLVDLNKTEVLKSFDTKSNLPILHIGYLKDRIIVSTCQGELFNISEDLSSFTSISAHQGMINLLHIGKDEKLSTYGDDCVLNIFNLSSSKQLNLVSSQSFKKRANMLLTIAGEELINFYEQLNLQQMHEN